MKSVKMKHNQSTLSTNVNDKRNCKVLESMGNCGYGSVPKVQNFGQESRSLMEGQNWIYPLDPDSGALSKAVIRLPSQVVQEQEPAPVFPLRVSGKETQLRKLPLGLRPIGTKVRHHGIKSAVKVSKLYEYIMPSVRITKANVPRFQSPILPPIPESEPGFPKAKFTVHHRKIINAVKPEVPKQLKPSKTFPSAYGTQEPPGTTKQSETPKSSTGDLWDSILCAKYLEAANPLDRNDPDIQDFLNLGTLDDDLDLDSPGFQPFDGKFDSTDFSEFQD